MHPMTALPMPWPKKVLTMFSRAFGPKPAFSDSHPILNEDEAPLRAELFSPEQLEQHADSLAQTHSITTKRHPDKLLHRLRENQEVIKKSYRLVAEMVHASKPIPPAAEWLLDNYYVIEEQCTLIREHLPNQYSRELPILSNGPFMGYPRIYHLASEFISHVDGRVDVANLAHFLNRYQKHVHLNLGELWAIPIMLRLALVENVRRVSQRICMAGNEYEQAAEWSGKLIQMADQDPKNLVLVLAEMANAELPTTSSFVSEFCRRLQGQSATLALALSWFEQRLTELGLTSEQLILAESQSQASDQVSMGNTVTSMRGLSAIVWQDFVEKNSTMEKILREDPAGIYSNMDFNTRDHYRRIIEQISKKGRQPEEVVAQEIVDRSRRISRINPGNVAGHIGWHLRDRGLAELLTKYKCRVIGLDNKTSTSTNAKGAIYLGSIAMVTALLTLPILYGLYQYDTELILMVVISLFCGLGLSQVAIQIVNTVAMSINRPTQLPRMDFSKGIPDSCRTIVAIPTMLSSQKNIRHLIEGLEVRYLANVDRNLYFTLLTDFPDAQLEINTAERKLLSELVDAVQALNSKYASDRPSIFYLFHRPRRKNESEGVWMGYERKRGKLNDFNSVLRGHGSERFMEIVGEQNLLHTFRYVITLDTDTQLPRDAAKELVGAMAHPLNTPVFDAKSNRVVGGYSILQPRVALNLSTAGVSYYSWLNSLDAGIDPYTRIISDVYQDLFGEGSFVGKGIYDIDSFEKSCGQHFPENRILSHDLIEGCYSRSGLLSDVELMEDYPSRYVVDARRRHRWIRGDWQIAGWLWSKVPSFHAKDKVNPLSYVSQWKIFDNLRRSLIAPVTILAMFLSWILLDNSAACLVTLLLLSLPILPQLISILADALSALCKASPSRRSMRLGESVKTQFIKFGLDMVFLCSDAVLNADAILRTLYRLYVSKRRLLEWQTANDAERMVKTDLAGTYYEMRYSCAAVSILGVEVAIFSPHNFLLAFPLLLLWGGAPFVAWVISQPHKLKQRQLDLGEQQFLREVARRTWHFFETFLTDRDNWLPPDNYQETPQPLVAHRTSPTNIGVALLSTMAARDFGYISSKTMLERLQRTIDGMKKLQQYNGHLYNWYDTESLQPLKPLYVSTVDSGNFFGHLLTLQVGLQEISTAPILPENLNGVLDTLRCFEAALMETAKESGTNIKTLQAVRKSVDEMEEHAYAGSGNFIKVYQELVWIRNSIRTLNQTCLKELSHSPAAGWATSLQNQTEDFCAYAESLFPWLADSELQKLMVAKSEFKAFERTPNLRALAQFDNVGNATDWKASTCHAKEVIETANDLIAQLDPFLHMQFEFLFDRNKKLLSIGYNVSDHRLDNSFYDLLASEARLASYLGIAVGALPREHWFKLGRKLTNAGKSAALVSWSGSMFEYLMPALVMPSCEGSILNQTCRAVVEHQEQYGNEHSIPWGISESGFNTRDIQQNYQYHAFGVPGLGFKRGLRDDLVIAPYATVMAVMVDPVLACENLQQLVKMGAYTSYGFYEAIDYTPTRLMKGQSMALVRSFMAHHQGMAFLALASELLGQPMQRRFLKDPRLKAIESLLQERVPRQVETIELPNADENTVTKNPETNQSTVRSFSTPNTERPHVQLLSNGRYSVMLTNSGGGYSQWKGLQLTRWREDATCDHWGQFCFLRDTESGAVWSATYQPTSALPEDYGVLFTNSNVEYRRRDEGIQTHLSICVSPEDDVEIRRLKVTNTGYSQRQLEFTTYAEVVLNPAAADAAHPSFGNLFIDTQILEERRAILCTRRPRSHDAMQPWMFHLLTVPDAPHASISYETDRAKFVGRNRSVGDAVVLSENKPLSNTCGAVLDPIVALRHSFTLNPGETREFELVTGAAESREIAIGLVNKFHDYRLCERAFDVAWSNSRVVLAQLNSTEVDGQTYSELAGPILFASPAFRAAAPVLERNRQGQSRLWVYGISGDYPIVLLRVSDNTGIALAAEVLRAHAYLRMKGLLFDLVIWNEDGSNYRQTLHDEIMGLVLSGSEAVLLDQPGGVFVKRGDLITEEDRVLLQTVARVTLFEGRGALVEQLKRALKAESTTRFTPPKLLFPKIPTHSHDQHSLRYFNGYGGFSSDGREYVVHLQPGVSTPAPWCNVLANAQFGTVVSESGSAYSWADNAHEFRLTPWNNDPLTDSSGEHFYIRDEESGMFWSPTPMPSRGKGAYTVTHGQGYSVFDHEMEGISSKLTIFVPPNAPVKVAILKLNNLDKRKRRLSIFGYWEWVLGEMRTKTGMHINTEVDLHSGALLAQNPYHSEFGGKVCVVASSERPRSFTCDRGEFVGRNGSLQFPAALSRMRLKGTNGVALDPCAALQSTIELNARSERTVVFILGSGADAKQALQLVQEFGSSLAANSALERCKAYWSELLGAIQVSTPQPSTDFLCNGWLLYQVTACRLWARSGFYQSGGAYGFRDQLQDVLSLLHTKPELAREHLLKCASRQFTDGDVQHWWHPPSGRGVRTLFSDDYLWLPYAVAMYVRTTGDTGVLNEKVSFLSGRAVKGPEEEAYYDLPQQANSSDTLYVHCTRALERAVARVGAHGLPLMGCGDWNDGMNLVGIKGQGESVWLAFFLCEILKKFSHLAESILDSDRQLKCQEQAEKMAQLIEKNAWDGDWYLRAFFDDGTPLGSKQNDECQIDILPQSWSVISGVGSPERVKTAMSHAEERLIHRNQGLIKLFDPPFDRTELNPGYIKAYLPGVRENGGQYTHGAIWAVMAFALKGENEKAWELFNLLNPINHGNSRSAIERYKVEPYVMAADIYGCHPHIGRGGWTWYTGSAGWMYRLLTESLLGILKEGKSLQIRPRLPKSWNEITIRYRYGTALYMIKVSQGNERGSLTIDGVEQEFPDKFELCDDHSEHHVELRIQKLSAS